MLDIKLGIKKFEIDEMEAAKAKKRVLCLGLSLATLAGTGLMLLNSAIAQSASLSLARNFRPDPIKLQGRAGGSVNMTNLAGQSNCRGFASEQPNHTLNLTDNFPLVDLLVYTGNVKDDTTMLIKGSNGAVMCADDEYQGRNPQLSRRLPEGTYQIWIGSRNADQSINYTLSLSEIKQK
jgi:hypothetical protein